MNSLVAWIFSILLSYLPTVGVLSFTGTLDGVPMRCLTDRTVSPDWLCYPSPFPDDLRSLAKRYSGLEAAGIYRGIK